jgi:hypothetical protein
MSDDRDPTSGRFLPGNAGGPGNPYAKRIAALREALLAEVTPEDLRAIVRALVDQAKTGDVTAAREILLRTLGKPLEADLLERIEALEARLEETSAPGASGRGGRNA